MKNNIRLEELGIVNINPLYEPITPNEKRFPQTFKDPIEKINKLHKTMSEEFKLMNKEIEDILKEIGDWENE